MKQKVLVLIVGILCGEILKAKVPPTAQRPTTTIQREQTTAQVTNALPTNQEMAIIQRWFGQRNISSTGLQIGKKVLNDNKSLFLIFPTDREDAERNLIAPDRAVRGLLTNKLRMAGYLAKGILLFGTISGGAFDDITEDAITTGLAQNNSTVDEVIANRRTNPRCAQFFAKYAAIIDGN